MGRLSSLGLQFRAVHPTTWQSKRARHRCRPRPKFRLLVGEASTSKGPRGEKRPANVIRVSVKVMRIAAGEEERRDFGEIGGETMVG